MLDDNLQIKKMTQKEADEIADYWKYPEPYDFYNMTADKEDYDEIVDPLARGDKFFSITKGQELIGFFCIFPKEPATGEIELGLGMKPELTGKGLGEVFVELIVEYLQANYLDQVIWLSVADFNQRALKVYKQVGFNYVTDKLQKTNGGEYNFIVMNNVE
ncbi:MAG: GNAT family N-acetyltransferase [Tetragenococcus sp.]|nr:GNAT family N-acetyltransferase [Tetragenococcus sp.]